MIFIAKKNIKKLIKILLYLLLSVFGILIFISLTLHIPAVQNYATRSLIEVIEKKIDTRIELSQLRFSIPNGVKINDVYIEDINNDSLFACKMLKIRVGLFKLLKKKINIHQIHIKSADFKMKKFTDNEFNFNIFKSAPKKNKKDNSSKKNNKSKKNFTIDHIKLENIRFSSVDYMTHNSIIVRLGYFKTKINNFSPAKKELNINRFHLKNMDLLVHTNTVKIKQNNKVDFHVNLSHKSSLENIKIVMNNHVMKSNLKISGHELTISPDNIQLESKTVDLDEVRIEKFDVDLSKLKSAPEDSVQIARIKKLRENKKFDWQIMVDDVIVHRSNFAIHDKNIRTSLSKIDFKQPGLENINASIKNVHIERNNFIASLRSLTFHDKSGFRLTSFKTNLAFNNQTLRLSDLRLKTPYSHIQNSISLDFPLSPEFNNKLYDAKLSFKLTKSKVGITDLLFFTPSTIDTYINIDKDTVIPIHINTQMTGSLNDLNVDELKISIPDMLSLNSSGYLSNINKPQKASMFIRVDSMNAITQNVGQLFADTIISDHLHFPEKVNIKALIRGTLNDVEGNINVTSPFGHITSKVNFSRDSTTLQEYYSAKMNIDTLDLGQLFSKQDTIGKISCQVNIAARSENLKNPDMVIDAMIDSASFMMYMYKDIKVNGHYKNETIYGDITVADQNADLELKGRTSLNKSLPIHEFMLDVRGIDMQALNLTREDIRLKGQLNSYLQGNKNKANGYLNLKKFLLLKSQTQYSIDSFNVKTTNYQDTLSATISSDLMDMTYTGFSDITKFTSIVKKHVKKYFPEHEKQKKDTLTYSNFSMNLDIKETELITEVLFPDLKGFAPAQFFASYDQNNDQLNILASFPNISYGSYNIDSVELKVNSNDQKLLGNLDIKAISDEKNIALGTFNSIIKTMDDQFHIKMSILNENKTPAYHIHGLIRYDTTKYFLHIIPDSLILNNQFWNIPKKNKVEFDNKNVTLYELNISNKNQKLEVNNICDEQEGSTSSIQINFEQFNIRNILYMALSSEKDMSAILDGTVNFNKKNELPVINLVISDLSYEKNYFFEKGSFVINRVNQNKYFISSELEGYGNNVSIVGNYSTENSIPGYSIETQISSLNVETFTPLVQQEFSDLSGQIKGNITVLKDNKDPVVNGRINFYDITTHPLIVNSSYKIKEEIIDISDNRISVSNFTVYDDNNNKLVINGKTDLFSNKYHFEFEANNFKVLNTNASDNQSYYGKVITSATATLRGGQNDISVNLNTSLKDGSSIFFAVPDVNPPSVEQKGIVEFINEDTIINPILTNEKEQDTIFRGQKMKMDLTALIEVDANTMFTIITDQASNEKLQLRGNANLALSQKANKLISLTGQYIIKDGSYTLILYDLIRRRFTIKDGSSIAWSGDILDAKADISAIHRIRTSPIGLVSNDLVEMSDEEMRRYKQSVPFEVYLNLNGELLSPDIDFDIKLPPEDRDAIIENKLTRLNQNESELNKQVFSLLIFQSFIEQTSSTRPIGYEIDTKARSGISRLLSQQLNRFANQYIKDVDISLDVASYADYYDDKTYGTTQLQMDVSREFLDDRLSVQIGGNVNLEGQKKENRSELSSIAGDVSIEYDLTQNGVYKIQGFNKTEYENVLNGEIRKTGVALIFNKSFYSIKELFQNKNIEEKNSENNNK